MDFWMLKFSFILLMYQYFLICNVKIACSSSHGAFLNIFNYDEFIKK